MRKCMELFASLLRARDTCLYVHTYEEQEFIQDICRFVSDETFKDRADIYGPNTEIYTYSRAEGLYKLDPKDPFSFDRKELIKQVKNIPGLFQFIQSKQSQVELVDDFNGFRDAIVQPGELEDTDKRKDTDDQAPEKICLFILKDMHLFFDKDTIRWIRDLKEHYDEESYCPIIVTAPAVDLPCELEKIFTYFEYELMSLEDIHDFIYEDMHELSYDDAYIADVCKACVGLTAREIWRALCHSATKYDTIDLKSIQEEKVQIVKKSGALDYLTPKQTMEDTGGYENLKTWIKELKTSLDPQAKEYGVPQPRGAMLVGLPGNGKTMAAEVTANYLNIPLLQLDLAKIMGSFVGQSERAIANALRIAKACAPCVMLIDEAEKLFGG